ncbi:MAG: AAA family ATPase, partial [Candidatus Aenigmatarchaeota archaeon]
RLRIFELFKTFTSTNRIKSDEDKIFVHSTPLKKFLESIFEMDLKAKSKMIRVPPVLFKAEPKVIAAFLRGAWNGDGHINKRKAEYGTASEELAHGITYLLSFAGIKSRFWKRKDGLSMITVSGKRELDRFNKFVFGISTDENIRQFYNARYRIPDISTLLRKSKQNLGLIYGKTLPEGLAEGIISKRKRCGLLRLRRIMVYIDKYATEAFKQSETYKTLKKISEGELLWVSLKRKERAPGQWMYDMETEHGSFVGGKLPMLLHNSKWVGESEQHLREIFRRARQVAPSIIFFDEIDALTPRRGLDAGSRVTEQVVSQLLTEMSGLEELHDVVVVAATNRPDIIDPALLRPGRFDRLIYVPAPDEPTREEILKVHTKGMPLKGVDLKELAKRTKGYSGADINAVCREAALNALRKDINAKEVNKKHFELAMKKVKPSITSDMFVKYQKVIEEVKKAKIEEEERSRYIG